MDHLKVLVDLLTDLEKSTEELDGKRMVNIQVLLGLLKSKLEQTVATFPDGPPDGG